MKVVYEVILAAAVISICGGVLLNELNKTQESVADEFMKMKARQINIMYQLKLEHKRVEQLEQDLDYFIRKYKAV